jgi:hypothetical protein
VVSLIFLLNQELGVTIRALAVFENSAIEALLDYVINFCLKPLRYWKVAFLLCFMGYSVDTNWGVDVLLYSS